MDYLLTFHPLLLKVIWQDFLKGSIFVDNATIASSPFYANAYPAVDKIRHPDLWASVKGLQELSSVNSLQATRILDRSQLDPYVLLWRNIPLGAIVILSFVLGSASCIPGRKVPTTIVVGFFALGTGAMIFAANCVCVYYMPRYTLPLLTTAVFGFLASITPFIEGVARAS